MWMIACGSVQPAPRLYCVLLSCLFEVVGWDQDQEEEEVDTSYSSNVHTVTQKIYTLQQHQQADCTLMHKKWELRLQKGVFGQFKVYW